jgi:hypothetical protein
MREVPFAQVEPDALDWVQLGRIGRQANQRQIVGHGQIAAGVPPGAVEDHDGVLVGRQRRREASEKLAHGRGRDRRQHQAEVAPGGWFDRCESIGKGVALIDRSGRSLAAQPPAMTGAALLADPGFILEVQRDPLVRVRVRGAGQRRRKLLF